MNKNNKILNNIYIIRNQKYYNIKAKIIGYSLIHLSGFNNDYVEYTISVKTDYSKWRFKKRYEEFSTLNNKLKNQIPEINNYFPPKRVFKNSESTIKERIKYFNKYLKFLMNKINIFLFNDIINFIYLDFENISLIIKKFNMLKLNLKEDYIYESLIDIFSKNNLNLNQKEKNNEDKNMSNPSSLNNNYYNSVYEYEKTRQKSSNLDEPQTITPLSFVIHEFLKNLCETDSNKDDIFKTFEDFLQQRRKWINFSTKDITELFLGFDEINNEEEKENRVEYNNRKTIPLFQWLNIIAKKNSKKEDLIDSDDDEENDEIKIPGLFQQIGDFQKNVFSSIEALNFLEKLLNDDYNPDYDKYLNIFQNLQIYQYNYMKLNDIIKYSVGGNKTSMKAMKILALIFSDKKWEKYQKEIITDQNVYNEYINYLNNFS